MLFRFLPSTQVKTPLITPNSYFFDNETGFYYLQSRYYDPELHRFINADSPEYSVLGATSFLGSNLFAYSQNNPVAYSDENGEWIHLAIGAVIGAAIGCISAIASGGDVGEVIISTVAGGASGFLAATGVGAVGQAIGGAAIAMTSNAASQIHKNEGFDNFDVGDMLFDGTVGAVTGALGGSGASAGNSAGIMSSGKQFVKSMSKQAWKYYTKQAHKAGGEFVLTALKKSLLISGAGSLVVTVKNNVKNWLEE